LRRVADNEIVRKPFRGAATTITAIRDAALSSQQNFAVRQLAELICEGIRSKDYLSEYLAIHNFVWGLTRYMRDPRTIELVKDPGVVCEELLEGGRPQLDCDDLTALELALLLSIGAQARIVTLAFQNLFYKGERQYTHVLIEAREPRSGAWIVCDPVAGVATRNMLKRAVAAKIWMVA